jgi:hypothetical protein
MLFALDTFHIAFTAANVHIISDEAALSANELVVSKTILVSVRCLIWGRLEFEESDAENNDTDVSWPI